LKVDVAMQQQLEELSQKLDQTEEIYGQLISLETDKQRAILQREPARVIEMLDEERDLVARATELEAGVLESRDAIGALLGDLPASGGEPVTLREIATAIEAPVGERLEGKRLRLLQLATVLRQTSQTNLLLLRQCSTLLEEILQAAVGEQPGGTYGKKGLATRTPGSVGVMVDLVAGE